MLHQEVKKTFGNRLRIRVCGLCVENNKLLVIKHTGLGNRSFFLAPPGGGMDFGTDARANLVREFREETGIAITVGTFLFVYEYINDPLHAVELFFRVKKTGGNLVIGNDPELSKANQIIHSVSFLSYQEIISYPEGQPHGIFNYCSSLEELLNLKGYFTSFVNCI